MNLQVYREDMQYNDRFKEDKDFYPKSLFDGVDPRTDSMKILEKRFGFRKSKSDYCLRHEHSFKGKVCDFCEHI